MYLGIDCGNTRTKIALFEADGTIRAVFRRNSLQQPWLEEVFKKHRILGTILCSVVHHDEAAEAFLRESAPFILVSPLLKLPLELAYLTPQTLGRDRLAAACGACFLYPDRHCLVVDAGTCVKYDFVSAEGVYRGGAIAPGIGMRLRAMHDFTAKLPLVERGVIDDFIGTSTETALRVGGQLGAAMEVRGFVAKYEERFGEAVLLLTGGDAPLLKAELPQAVHLPDLLFAGLWGLLQLNLFTDTVKN